VVLSFGIADDAAAGGGVCASIVAATLDSLATLPPLETGGDEAVGAFVASFVSFAQAAPASPIADATAATRIHCLDFMRLSFRSLQEAPDDARRARSQSAARACQRRASIAALW
jgi:hypothetical protein